MNKIQTSENRTGFLKKLRDSHVRSPVLKQVRLEDEKKKIY